MGCECEVRAVTVQVLQLLARFQIDTELKITFVWPGYFHAQEGKVRVSHNLCFWVAHLIILSFSPNTDSKDQSFVLASDFVGLVLLEGSSNHSLMSLLDLTPSMMTNPLSL
jgi:hypothetical protein